MIRSGRPQALKVGAAQIASRLGDVEANLDVHCSAIEAARLNGVELLLFPELSLVGHSAGAEALRLAEPLDGSVVQRLAQAAGPMATAFGLIEATCSGLVYNSLVVVRDGGLVACHRKAALATYGRLDDGKYFARGAGLNLCVPQPGWHAALGLCNDVWQPALVTAAMMSGASLLLVAASSAVEAVGPGFDNPAGWELNLRFNAMTWGCPVVMANRVGTEGDLSFWGGSRILDAFGRELARAASADEQLVQATLDLATMREARFLLPTLRDALALASTSQPEPADV